MKPKRVEARVSEASDAREEERRHVDIERGHWICSVQLSSLGTYSTTPRDNMDSSIQPNPTVVEVVGESLGQCLTHAHLAVFVCLGDGICHRERRERKTRRIRSPKPTPHRQ